MELYVYEAGWFHQIDPQYYGLFSNKEKAMECVKSMTRNDLIPTFEDDNCIYFKSGHYIRKVAVK